jgi:predicted lactoylglutathione lyase
MFHTLLLAGILLVASPAIAKSEPVSAREAVDGMIDAANAFGGKADIREPQDMGWLYTRAFEDPDGHVFEAIWMDMGAAPAEMEG